MKDIKLFFSTFISLLEGAKTICKAQHWGAKDLPVDDKRGTHIYLDDFLEIISDYQDTISESCQGILGTFLNQENIKGSFDKEINTPIELIDTLLPNVKYFYEKLPKDFIYIGIKSETETFVKDLIKYRYLFNLTA